MSFHGTVIVAWPRLATGTRMLRIHRLSSQLWMPVGNMADLKYRQHAMMKVHDETKREPFLFAAKALWDLFKNLKPSLASSCVTGHFNGVMWAMATAPWLVRLVCFCQGLFMLKNAAYWSGRAGRFLQEFHFPTSCAGCCCNRPPAQAVQNGCVPPFTCSFQVMIHFP